MMVDRLSAVGFEALRVWLEEWEKKGLRRVLRRVEGVEGGRICIGGKWYLHLGSNDYLGMSQHPKVLAAVEEANRRYGTGARSARFIAGNLPPHEALEEELARFKQAEACLIFSSGYAAGLGVVSALVGAKDLVLADRLDHACLVDGCRLSGATFRVYPHKDADRVEEILKHRRMRYRHVLIVTEGIFSMDGDLAPLDRLADLARRYEAWLLVDDAHGTGVFGASGRGTLEHCGVFPEGILQLGTLSKALGSVGGYLAGPKVVVEFLRQRARPFVYSTALPPACAAGALEALKVIQSEPVWRQRLWQNVEFWRSGLNELGQAVLPSIGPIVPLWTGSVEETMALAQAWWEAGVFAPGIRPPTVPADAGRVRTSLTALHTQQDLEAALQALKWMTLKKR
jgi:glycine C-acetyltransferase/8-amino-7-oxononanoate synthase